MHHKVLLGIFLGLFLIFGGVSSYFGFKFFKSYKLGSDYESTECVVEKKIDYGICDIDSSSACYKENNDIWWYNNWGSNPYIIVINGGGGNHIYPTDDGNYDDDGEYDDDDGDDDDGEEDDGEEDDGEEDDDDDDGGEDTGEYDDDDDDDDGDYDDDDDDDDDGGDWGGDDGGDDDVMKTYDTTLKNSKNSATSGAGDLTNIREFKGIKKSLKQKLKNQIKLKNRIISSSINSNNTSSSFDSSISNNTNSDSSNNNNTSSMGSNDYSGCNDSGCYQGIFHVYYNTIDSNGYNKTINSTINGLVSTESDWIKSYLNQYTIGSNYTCWYNSKEPSNVIWFKPPKVKVGLLVGFIIFGAVTLIWLMAFIGVGIAKIKQHHHHHHHGYKRINH